MEELEWIFGSLAALVLCCAPLASDWKRTFNPVRPVQMVIPTQGIPFENWCADQLRAQGWRCTMTRKSGDHGVDIVAEQRNIRVAIQVKSWSARVGNGAVQEVVAGRVMYGCTHMAVISRSGYKPAALMLAKANGVHMLHTHDLASLLIVLPPAKPSRLRRLFQ